MNTGSPHQHYATQDPAPLDFLQLVGELWREKWVMIAAALIGVITAVIFTYMSETLYEASIHVMPPDAEDNLALNLGREQLELSVVSGEDIHEVIVEKLYSDSVRAALRGLSDERVATSALTEQISVSAGDGGLNKPGHTVRVRSADREHAGKRASEYVALVERQALESLQERLAREINAKRAELTLELDILRTYARTQRLDRIVRLREALTVAEAVDIDFPHLTIGEIGRIEDVARLLDGGLLYLRGSRAIRAELALLESRTSDDPYIDELRQVERDLALLAKLALAVDEPKHYALASTSEVAERTLSPSRRVFAVLGLFAGVLAGLAVALARIALRRSR